MSRFVLVIFLLYSHTYRTNGDAVSNTSASSSVVVDGFASLDACEAAKEKIRGGKEHGDTDFYAECLDRLPEPPAQEEPTK